MSTSNTDFVQLQKVKLPNFLYNKTLSVLKSHWTKTLIFQKCNSLHRNLNISFVLSKRNLTIVHKSSQNKDSSLILAVCFIRGCSCLYALCVQITTEVRQVHIPACGCWIIQSSNIQYFLIKISTKRHRQTREDHLW